MRRIGEIDLVQKLGRLAEMSGTVYPGLYDLSREAVVEIDELRALVAAAACDRRDCTRH